MRISSFRLLLPALLAATFTVSALGQDDKAERTKLEGTWVGGVRAPAGKGKGGSATMVQISELVIKDGKLTAKDGKGLGLGTGTGYTLNLNANPKTFDAVGNTKEKQGTFQGIYRLNGDTLEWCAANPGIARPKDFFTTPQVQFHLVLQRKK